MHTETAATECTDKMPSTPLAFDIAFDALVDDVTGTVWEDLFDTVDVCLSKERLYPIVRESVATALRRHIV